MPLDLALIFKQDDRVARADDASLEHGAVERHCTVEFADDALQDIAILLQSVRIKGGHNTTAAQFLGMDGYSADLEASAWPLTLLQTLDTADDDVWTQAPAVETHVVYRAVGGHQQREHIKAFGAVVLHELRIPPRGFPHQLQCLRRIPAMT